MENPCYGSQKFRELYEAMLSIPVEPPVNVSWGRCFSDQPQSVKIRFYKEGNVWEKIRKNPAYRSYGKLYEKDGYFYYEDVVYGNSAFRTWLYGYGSSVIVLEPESLRQHSIDSLRERKESF